MHLIYLGQVGDFVFRQRQDFDAGREVGWHAPQGGQDVAVKQQSLQQERGGKATSRLVKINISS